MAALTADIPTERYGTPGNAAQPVNLNMASGTVNSPTTVYRGSIAITRSGFCTPATNAAILSTDIVWGIVEQAGPGTADTGPGITNTGASSTVTVEVATGTFFLASSTGADALGVTTLGKTVYVYDEQTVAATNGSNTRPVAGIHAYTDSTRTNAPGIYAITLGTAQSTGSP
jgi:hypothetical protein